jgi:photosystem II stability/assembly factor-like uncharacterized protein
MKYLFILNIFFLSLVYNEMYAQTIPLQTEIEDKDGILQKINEERMEMLIRTAGTKNVSSIIYKENVKFKSLENARSAAGYTPESGNWQQVNLANSTWGMGRINCYKIDPNNSNIIYAGTPTGGLWKTINNGVTWVNLTKALPVPGVSGICIDPANTDIIYILTGTASSVECQSIGVFKSIDGGTNWLPTGLDTTYQPHYGDTGWNANKLLMDKTNSNILFACMTDGLYRTTDAGANWTKISLGANYNVVDIAQHPTNSSYLYISIYYGYIMTSNNNGATFSNIQSVPTAAFSNNYRSCNIAVTPAAPDSVFFVMTTSETASGIALDSIFIGRGRFNGTTNNISFGTSRKCFYPGGYLTSALRWNRDARLAVSPFSTANMYIGGLETYSSSNYGVNWIAKSYNASSVQTVHSDCTQMDYVGSNIYTCNDGGIYTQPATSGTSTTNWVALTGTMPISQIFKIGASQVSVTNFNVALQDNGCHIRTASSYTLLQEGDGVVARMDPNNEQLYYGSYVAGYALTKYRNSVGYSLNPTTTFETYGSGYGFLPFEVDQNNGKFLYTAYKAFYKSSDTGNVWTRYNFGGTHNTKLMAVSKSNSNVIWILEDEIFTVRKTINGGTAFNIVAIPATIPKSQISSIVISPHNENTVYLTIDGYTNGKKIYETKDGGVNWRNISDNLPNVPANCFAYEDEADSSMYIGTEIGVYYRNKNLGRWVSFNNGMPVCRISEFYINRVSVKIIAATYGRGIFISDLASGSCNPNVILSGTVSGINTWSAGTQLNSTQNISGGSATNIKYYAGSVAYMQPGFIAPSGSRLLIGIAPCGGFIDTILNRQTNINDSIKKNNEQLIKIPLITNKKQPDKKEDENRNDVKAVIKKE